ncbi:hypothetical protein [Stutzerimonas degradans]|nr:hypothetical protein [Stutzerimonas degradans]
MLITPWRCASEIRAAEDAAPGAIPEAFATALHRHRPTAKA